MREGVEAPCGRPKGARIRLVAAPRARSSITNAWQLTLLAGREAGWAVAIAAAARHGLRLAGQGLCLARGGLHGHRGAGHGHGGHSCAGLHVCEDHQRNEAERGGIDLWEADVVETSGDGEACSEFCRGRATFQHVAPVALVLQPLTMSAARFNRHFQPGTRVGNHTARL